MVRELFNDIAMALDMFMLEHAVPFKGIVVVPHGEWNMILRNYDISNTAAFMTRPKLKGIELHPGSVRTPELQAELRASVRALEDGTEVIFHTRADNGRLVSVNGDPALGECSDIIPIASTAGVRPRHRQPGNLRTRG